MSKFKELARLKELEAKATPARWSLTQYSDDILEISREDGTRGFQILFEDSDIDDPQFITDLRNAAPWLLKIAEAFQPGDSIMLRELAHDEEQTAKFIAGFGQQDTRKATMLRRLQKAAEELDHDA